MMHDHKGGPKRPPKPPSWEDEEEDDSPDLTFERSITNIYLPACDNTDILEEIMALREDIVAELEDLKSSVTALADAITNLSGSGGAARIAELEGVIAQLQAEGAADQETIDRLQAVADGVSADNDALLASLQEVDASIDSLTQTAQTAPEEPQP